MNNNEFRPDDYHTQNAIMKKIFWLVIRGIAYIIAASVVVAFLISAAKTLVHEAIK